MSDQDDKAKNEGGGDEKGKVPIKIVPLDEALLLNKRSFKIGGSRRSPAPRPTKKDGGRKSSRSD